MSHCCTTICGVAPSSLSNSWLDTSGFGKESSPAGFLHKEQGHNRPMDALVTGMVALAMVCAWKRTPGSTAYLPILICKICNSKATQQNHTLQHLLVWSHYQIPSNMSQTVQILPDGQLVQKVWDRHTGWSLRKESKQEVSLGSNQWGETENQYFSKCYNCH
jgi:hypothetical protein